MTHLRLWTLTSCLSWFALGLMPGPALAQDMTPRTTLAHYENLAGQSGVPVRGKVLFTASHGQRWKCTSCHQANPALPGRHASTGKAIEPLAPAASADRFTRLAKTEKWFRRNCQDVLDRSCTDQEKADVLAWLITVKP